jgi:hypothetical protein
VSEQDTYTSVPSTRIAASAPTGPGPRSGSLGTIIARIEEAIEAETAAIRTDVNFDLKASNARKSRHLYDLNRAVRDVGAGALEAHRPDIARLRDKLADNESAIKAHLSAVNEVARLLQDAIERSEDDGTYSTRTFGGGGGL